MNTQESQESQETHAPEQTIWSGRPSHWNYFGSYLLGVIGGAVLVPALYFLNRESPAVFSGAMPWAYGLGIVPLLLVFGFVAFAQFKRFYRITNRRVSMEIGLVVKDSNEIRIQDIRSINVSKSGIGGWLGIGTVEFSSAASDDAEVVFFKIAGADQVRDIVRKLQS